MVDIILKLFNMEMVRYSVLERGLVFGVSIWIISLLGGIVKGNFPYWDEYCISVTTDILLFCQMQNLTWKMLCLKGMKWTTPQILEKAAALDLMVSNHTVSDTN